MKDLYYDFLAVKDLVFIISFNGHERILFQILNVSPAVLIAAAVSVYIPDGNRNIFFVLHRNVKFGAGGNGSAVF